MVNLHKFWESVWKATSSLSATQDTCKSDWNTENNGLETVSASNENFVILGIYLSEFSGVSYWFWSYMTTQSALHLTETSIHTPWFWWSSAIASLFQQISLTLNIYQHLQRGAKWFRFSASIHHPLGFFLGHPFEGAGTEGSLNPHVFFYLLQWFAHFFTPQGSPVNLPSFVSSWWLSTPLKRIFVNVGNLPKKSRTSRCFTCVNHHQFVVRIYWIYHETNHETEDCHTMGWSPCWLHHLFSGILQIVLH